MLINVIPGKSEQESKSLFFCAWERAHAMSHVSMITPPPPFIFLSYELKVSLSVLPLKSITLVSVGSHSCHNFRLSNFPPPTLSRWHKSGLWAAFIVLGNSSYSHALPHSQGSWPINVSGWVSPGFVKVWCVEVFVTSVKKVSYWSDHH